MTKWRSHPQLAERFLAEHPDDLQVIVHDGSRRLSGRSPELVWVTVTEMADDIFRGTILNTPQALQSVGRGTAIRFIASAAAPHPFMVTDKYLSERRGWTIHACSKCGMDELFDAPSDLIRGVFPDRPAGSHVEMLTAFCPLCGGVQALERRSAAPPAPKSPWWRFWAG